MTAAIRVNQWAAVTAWIKAASSEKKDFKWGWLCIFQILPNTYFLMLFINPIWNVSCKNFDIAKVRKKNTRVGISNRIC